MYKKEVDFSNLVSNNWTKCHFVLNCSTRANSTVLHCTAVLLLNKHFCFTRFSELKAVRNLKLKDQKAYHDEHTDIKIDIYNCNFIKRYIFYKNFCIFLYI